MASRKLTPLFVTLLLLAPAPALASDSETALALTVEVPDAPTALRLANDTVNADGKLKSPGEDVITRVHVEDANGLDDVTRLAFRYYRLDPAAGRVLVRESARDGFPPEQDNLTTALAEDRFAHAPLKDGQYAVNVTSTDRAGNATSVERTFVIRDVLSALRDWDVGAAILAPQTALAATAEVADANLGTTPEDPTNVTALGVVTLKLFRGSTLVDDTWTLVLGSTEVPGAQVALNLTALTAADPSVTTVNGTGAVRLATRVTPPAGAATGTYRLSLYHTPPGATALTLLGSRTLTLETATRLTALTLSPDPLPRGGALALEAELAPGDGAATLTARLLQDTGAGWTPVPGVPERVEALSALPRNATRAFLNHTWPEAGALPLGPRYAAEVEVAPVNGTSSREIREWALANAAPALSVAGCDGNVTAARPRAPVAFCAVMQDPDGDALVPAWDLVDWNGASIPGSGATLTVDAANASRASLTVSPSLAPGRYTLRVSARDAGGLSTNATNPLDVGAWAGLDVKGPGLRATAANGRLAGLVDVENPGQSPVSRIVLQVPERAEAPGRALPLDGATLRLTSANGTALASATVSAGRATFERAGGALIGPGEAARLEIDLALAPGTDAGTYLAEIRLLVTPGAAA